MADRDSIADSLLQLSRKLKLNDRQTRFVMELVKDPERNQTRCAIAVGVAPKGAHVWASRALRLPKVVKFLSKVEEAIAQRAEEKARREDALAAAPIEEAVMEAAEHELRLSRLARADIGRHILIDQDGRATVKLDPAHTGIIREITTKELFGGDESKGVVLETRIKVADPLPALVALGRVKGWEKAEEAAGTGPLPEALALLGAVTVQTFKEAYLKLIAGGNGAGGNGHHPAR